MSIAIPLCPPQIPPNYPTSINFDHVHCRGVKTGPVNGKGPFDWNSYLHLFYRYSGPNEWFQAALPMPYHAMFRQTDEVVVEAIRDCPVGYLTMVLVQAAMCASTESACFEHWGTIFGWLVRGDVAVINGDDDANFRQVPRPVDHFTDSTASVFPFSVDTNAQNWQKHYAKLFTPPETLRNTGDGASQRVFPIFAVGADGQLAGRCAPFLHRWYQTAQLRIDFSPRSSLRQGGATRMQRTRLAEVFGVMR